MEHQCIQEARIQALEKEQVKTEVYYKNIQSDIEEIKESLKQLQQKPKESALWQPIVVEIVKLITTVILVLGALAGAEKLIAR